MKPRALRGRAHGDDAARVPPRRRSAGSCSGRASLRLVLRGLDAAHAAPRRERRDPNDGGARVVAAARRVPRRLRWHRPPDAAPARDGWLALRSRPLSVPRRTTEGHVWRQHRAEPLPIDDRTVLLLLEAIQTFEGRTLSYRALDVEQIGHVYEGLLERTVSRVEDVTLELEAGAQARTRVSRSASWSRRASTARRPSRACSSSAQALGVGHQGTPWPPMLSPSRTRAPALRVSRRCEAPRPPRALRPADAHRPVGLPLVHPKGAFVVVLGADRRETGTHYTPKSLTERIVEGDAHAARLRRTREGAPRAEWKLKTPEQLLDLKVCDPAMGSGAFLVQACRFLSARLVEAWAHRRASGPRRRSYRPGPRAAHQCREHAARGWRRAPRTRGASWPKRCLYGVDLNPLAVELAKLSLWLVTLSKGRSLRLPRPQPPSRRQPARYQPPRAAHGAVRWHRSSRLGTTLHGRTVRRSRLAEALAVRLRLRERCRSATFKTSRRWLHRRCGARELRVSDELRMRSLQRSSPLRARSRV